MYSAISRSPAAGEELVPGLASEERTSYRIAKFSLHDQISHVPSTIAPHAASSLLVTGFEGLT